MKQLLEAGVHFGHQTRRWNPKMAKYIFTERNGIYIIDLQKTVKKLEEAYNFVRDLAANGQSILFVGTKKQAQDAIKEEAERVGQYYVNARWLGGMLTNFRTMRTRIDRLAQLKKMEEDGTFDLHMKYIDRDAEFDTKGGYSVRGNLLTLTPENGEGVEYYKVEENRLRRLDAEKQPVTGALADNYTLQKTTE